MTEPVVFDNREPAKTIAKLKGFLMANYGGLPEETRERFLTLNADNNMASFLVSGMELLNRLCQEYEFFAKRDALETLGFVAFTVADIPLWDKGPRATQILAWASSELNGTPDGFEASPAVEADAGYAFVEPPPPIMPLPVGAVPPALPASGGNGGQTPETPPAG